MKAVIKQLESLKNQAEYKMKDSAYQAGRYSAYHTAIEMIKRTVGNDNICVCCGSIVPEGRQVCYACEHKERDG